MASPLAPLREALASVIASSQGVSGVDAVQVESWFRAPDPDHGDIALPCFHLAKLTGEEPPAVAERLSVELSGDPRYSTAAAGPYLNVTLSAASLAQLVVPAARAEGYVEGDEGAGKTVVIDFSSPNIAKPLGFHHIRSTVIGAAIARLHAARGWNVESVNYLGDWGKQFGLLATGFGRHGDPDRIGDAKHLVEVYVRANAEADVARLDAIIARPAELQATREALEAVRAEAPSDSKAAKKHDKKIKNLEKKVNALLAGDDPETARARLEAEADAARAARPAAVEKDREARLFLKRMEEGDEDALATWRRYREISVRDFEQVYARLGIAFAHLEGEARYQDVLEETVEQVRARPGTRIDEGAEVVDLPAAGNEPPAMLKTRDGTTLYLTRDIAAAQDRFARFAFHRSLYVVGKDQALHFSQLFRVLGAAGHDWAERCAHVPFGRLHGMSTRRGNIVFLDEVLEESVSKARAICEASDKIDPEHLDEAVEAIGVGAVVFGELRNLRANDYTFDWEDVLQFTGFTGPSVQFSHARACSILRRGGSEDLAGARLERLELEEERQVLRALASFPDVVARACDAYEPALVARAIFNLSQVVATYFTAGNQDRSKRILIEGDAELRRARLCLVDAIRATLAVGLELLGLRAPEAM